MTQIDSTRINNDVNGNPRFVVHYLAFNTPEEINSSFLTWANQKYAIAAMRTKCIGARAYRGRDFGGGVVFQSYQSNIETDVKKAFENFDRGTTADKAQREIHLTVMNDFEFYEPCKTAMRKVYQKGANFTAQQAFAEVLHQCALCAASLRKRFGTRVSREAIWYGACLVAMDFEDAITEDLKSA